MDTIRSIADELGAEIPDPIDHNRLRLIAESLGLKRTEHSIWTFTDFQTKQLKSAYRASWKKREFRKIEKALVT